MIPELTRRDLRVVALVAVISLPLLTSRLYASDEIQYFSYLRSLWFDRDLSFDNEYRALVARGVAARSGFAETNLALVTDTGLRPNFGTIGSALLWAPFYAVGDLTARGMRAAGLGTAVDGFSRPYIVAVCVGSLVYGLLALALSTASARAVVGRGRRAAWIVLAGTPLLFYVYLAPVFAHATSAFAVALFVFVWLRARASWSMRGMVALGASAGLMAMVREQDAFFVIGAVIDIARAWWRRAPPPRRPSIVALVGGAVAGLVAIAPQLWAYVVLNGRLGPSPLVSRKMSWQAPHALEVLFSPEHGFLFWTPLAVLAIGGLMLLVLKQVPLARRAAQDETRWIAACALLMIASQVYVAGSVESWTVAGSFGQRRFVALTPLLVLGIAALWTAARGWYRPVRVAVGVTLALALWWNLGLMAQFGMRTMDRQRLTLRANAWQSFVELPRAAPAIAWRFLANRESFYNR